MILKVYDGEERDGVIYDAWEYVDGIKTARCCVHPLTDLPSVMCTFEDRSVVTIHISTVAYLLNDEGKTIDKIYNKQKDEDTYETLSEAVADSKKKSLE